MFKHDMSEFVRGAPNPDGSFQSERLEAAFAGAGDWAPYVVGLGDRPVGFVFVRGLGGPTRVLNSFFVVRGMRRAGVGLWAVREVEARHPGAWEVAFQESNVRAVRFWRRVGEEIAPGAWTEERRPVPERPDLAPDSWISFRCPGP
ncbi:GNAT family N-acetyltransferase [Streptomyces pseudovenezuelae]|uniref:GNAT family N-acetyltransferase n=1 Tax=Streptomyces pseudovenezuelae TaxID=67350 RepID=A0ABZ1WVY1_9ACTN|nr:GNAT family N-acetyltransferase [Streptomyces pseudovenezuelae]